MLAAPLELAPVTVAGADRRGGHRSCHRGCIGSPCVRLQPALSHRGGISVAVLLGGRRRLGGRRCPCRRDAWRLRRLQPRHPLLREQRRVPQPVRRRLHDRGLDGVARGRRGGGRLRPLLQGTREEGEVHDALTGASARRRGLLGRGLRRRGGEGRDGRTMVGGRRRAGGEPRVLGQQASAVLRGQRRRVGIAVAVVDDEWAMQPRHGVVVGVVDGEAGVVRPERHGGHAGGDVALDLVGPAAASGAAGERLERRRRPPQRRPVVPEQLGQLVARPGPAGERITHASPIISTHACAAGLALIEVRTRVVAWQQELTSGAPRAATGGARWSARCCC